MTTRHCPCTRTRRAWQPDGTCATCRLRVHETQIMDAVKAVLIADPRCILWRNEIGHNTHFPDGTRRAGPIKYGIANPGGADLIGLYGMRFLAVECKTVRGNQTPDQQSFERWVTSRGGAYAVVRSEDEAQALLRRLQERST